MTEQGRAGEAGLEADIRNANIANLIAPAEENTPKRENLVIVALVIELTEEEVAVLKKKQYSPISTKPIL